MPRTENLQQARRSPRLRRRQHAALLAGTQWLITREMLGTIIDIASRQNASPEAIAAEMGRPLQNTHTVEVRDGIARIPVCGPMFRYANLFTECSGATSYEVLATDFTSTLADPAVRAIVLDIDSPGGQVNGCGELAQLIYEGRGVKPIVAHVSGLGCSAAYWLAAAADRIVATETALVGSIGVCMEIVDDSAHSAARGVRKMSIVSSQTPKKNLDPFASDDGRSEVQRVVDGLAAVFVRAIAQYRGTSEARVAANYGQGSVMVAEAADASGMVDGIARYEELHHELLSGTGSGSLRLRSSHARRAGSQPRAAARRQAEVVTAGSGSGRETPAVAPVARPALNAGQIAAAQRAADRDRGRAAVALGEGALPPAKTTAHARGREIVALAEQVAGSGSRLSPHTQPPPPFAVEQPVSPAKRAAERRRGRELVAVAEGRALFPAPNPERERGRAIVSSAERHAGGPRRP